MIVRLFPAAALLAILFCTAPQAGAEEIEPGLYLRTTYAFHNLSLNTIYIGAGNKIAIDPPNGVDPFDFEEAAKQTPEKVGTFKIEGNKIAVTWAGGKTQKFAVEFTKGKFSAYDGGLVSKADAYTPNQTLEATYAGSGMTANVSSSLTLKLTAAGRFTLVGLAGTHGLPGNAKAAEKTTEGTYNLSGNTLTLTPASGEASRHTVMPFSTALDPKKAKLSDDHMIFDGMNLKREK
jgi:hypothetical protein